MTAKNSALMDKLVETASEMYGKSLTVEAIWTTILTYLSTEPIYSENTEQKNALEQIRAQFVIEDLLNQMKTMMQSKTTSYMDTLNLQKLRKAMEKEAEQRDGIISLDIAVKCILASPTKTIQQTMKHGTSEGSSSSARIPTSVLHRETASEQSESGETAPTKEKQHQATIEEIVKKTKDMYNALAERIHGQDYALAAFASGYFHSMLRYAVGDNRNAPAAIFLFAGPPGVGKTFLAESVAEISGLPFRRFDMSEYSAHEAGMMLTGFDGVYKNSAPGALTEFVKKNPRCVLLFDEVEKSHPEVIHLFLQMLDAARLRDNHTKEEISFEQAIIIMTTNAGRGLYEESDTDNFADVPKRVIINALAQDIDPTTGAPFFPAALCSRFATGNVVMFNHMNVKSLNSIVTQVVDKTVKPVGENYDVDFEIDPDLYTAILFSQGNKADARTIKGKARNFIDDELLELFRLMTAENNHYDVSKLNRVKLTLDVSEKDTAVYQVFNMTERSEALIFGYRQEDQIFPVTEQYCQLHYTCDMNKAEEILNKKDISFVMINFEYGQHQEYSAFLNIEDIASDGREFLHNLRNKHRNVPVYLLEGKNHQYSPEERLSFIRSGISGMISIEDKEAAGELLYQICDELHRQRSMHEMISRGKVLHYETAQLVTETPDGLEAEIRLFDFSTKTAVDASDKEGLVDNMSRPNVRFDDVIGAEDVKDELRYFAEYLKNPRKYAGTGLRAPRGILLYGPPGTGKTLLAKALAGESNTTFISAQGNQFLKKYVGEGPESVHKLFKTARKYAPSILFIDEIDAIAKARTGSETDHHEDILTAFLAEMDGFGSDPSKPVFVLAATNYEVDQSSRRHLDEAILRRFDRRMLVDLPNGDERKRYLETRIASNPAFQVSEAQISNIAKRSVGMSLALLESVLELALRSAVRTGKLAVDDTILDEAFDTFNSGEEHKWSEETVLRTARHEAGHTLIYRLSGRKPSYVTIVSRGNFGGYMQRDEEDVFGYTRKDMLALIRTSLGGRAAEMVFYGKNDGVSTGPSGDLISATSYAKRMLCDYGMIEDFGLAALSEQDLASAGISLQVREQVNKILQEELNTAISILTKHKDCLDALANALVQNGHLNSEEVDEIVGRYVELP